MTISPKIRTMEREDAPMISEAFAAIGWNKPVSLYERYFSEQTAGTRIIYLAFVDTEDAPETGHEPEFAGYVTVVWESYYPPFRERKIPEIMDFNVLPRFRRRKIGTALLDRAEATIRTRSSIAGIGVGLYPDYGPAQILYVKRGYIPDGRGLYNGESWAAAMEMVRVDDSLTIQFEKSLE